MKIGLTSTDRDDALMARSVCIGIGWMNVIAGMVFAVVLARSIPSDDWFSIRGLALAALLVLPVLIASQGASLVLRCKFFGVRVARDGVALSDSERLNAHPPE